MSVRLLLLLFLLPAGLAAQRADYSWTIGDRIGVATGAGLLLLDWAQTLDGVRDGAREWNPILGHHPTEGRVNTFLASTLLLYGLAAWRLPKEERRILMAITLTTESIAVGHNFYVGAKLAWP